MKTRKPDIDQSRRNLIKGGAVVAVGALLPSFSQAATQPAETGSSKNTSQGVRDVSQLFENVYCPISRELYDSVKVMCWSRKE